MIRVFTEFLLSKETKRSHQQGCTREYSKVAISRRSEKTVLKSWWSPWNISTEVFSLQHCKLMACNLKNKKGFIIKSYTFFWTFLGISFFSNFSKALLLKQLLVLTCLTQTMPVLPSYRNQSFDLLSKSIDWFLYKDNTGI